MNQIDRLNKEIPSTPRFNGTLKTSYEIYQENKAKNKLVQIGLGLMAVGAILYAVWPK